MSRPADELIRMAAVALGGGGGAVARYAVGRVAAGWSAHSVELFPWPTFMVNLVGSFVLGLIAVSFRSHPQPIWWLLLGTGFCGGFTTFRRSVSKRSR